MVWIDAQICFGWFELIRFASGCCVWRRWSIVAADTNYACLQRHNKVKWVECRREIDSMLVCSSIESLSRPTSLHGQISMSSFRNPLCHQLNWNNWGLFPVSDHHGHVAFLQYSWAIYCHHHRLTVIGWMSTCQVWWHFIWMLRVLQTLMYIKMPTYIWVDQTVDAYITIMARGLDENFNAINLVLGTHNMPERHAGDNNAEALEAAVMKWKTERLMCSLLSVLASTPPLNPVKTSLSNVTSLKCDELTNVGREFVTESTQPSASPASATDNTTAGHRLSPSYQARVTCHYCRTVESLR